ncbi:MAG: cupin domain-containing protein [Acidobacteria bacterium]|nr:cupin domain-containing protein [Acidobacteriota bacterium]
MPFENLDHYPEHEIVPGYRARFIHTERMTLAYWTVDAGAALPVHAHPHEQVAHVLEGEFKMTVGGEQQVLKPGMVAVIPADMPHGGRALTPCRLLDVFQPVREDYRTTFSPPLE